MPKFESKEDVENEDVARRIVGFFTNRDVYTFEEEYAPVDWYTLDPDGRVDSVLEFKCRSVSSDKYDTTILTMDKYAALWEEANKWKADPYYVIRFTDSIKIIPIDKVVPNESLRKTIHRTFKKKRNHRTDKVDAIMIPVKDMDTICNWRSI